MLILQFEENIYNPQKLLRNVISVKNPIIGFNRDCISQSGAEKRKNEKIKKCIVKLLN
jgi:hypothetical protein